MMKNWFTHCNVRVKRKQNDYVCLYLARSAWSNRITQCAYWIELEQLVTAIYVGNHILFVASCLFEKWPCLSKPLADEAGKHCCGSRRHTLRLLGYRGQCGCNIENVNRVGDGWCFVIWPKQFNRLNEYGRNFSFSLVFQIHVMG